MTVTASELRAHAGNLDACRNRATIHSQLWYALAAAQDALTAAADQLEQPATTAAPSYPPIGSVSEGTLRPEDLIPAYLEIVATYAPEQHDAIRDDYADVLAILEQDDDASAASLYDAPDGYERAGYMLERLYDACSELAGPYTYFGSSEGDGASIGYWPDLESLKEDARYSREVVKLDDAPPDYIASVTDHGNVTLYAVTVREIWSVV